MTHNPYRQEWIEEIADLDRKTAEALERYCMDNSENPGAKEFLERTAPPPLEKSIMQIVNESRTYKRK